MGLSLHISIVPLILMVVSLQVWLPLGCVEEERDALLQLKGSLNYPNGTSLPSWIKGDARCCDWELVVCNSSTGRVTRLYLSGVRNGQLGDWYLNASLFLPFQELYQLNLRGNQIAGWVENKGFLNLKNLELLDLSFNTLNSSNIFQTIVMMTSLKTLRLQGCSLNGQLPTGLCDLNNLQELLMYDNNLSGFLPPCLANLTSLQQLHLYANHLKIPISLSPLYNLSKLKSFDGSDNEIYAEEDDHNLSPKFQLESLYLSSHGQVAGAFPKFLQHQFNLQSLDLTNIHIKGELPSWLIENNTYLKSLYLENCSLSGLFLLPRSSHVNLSILSISMNDLQGQIPAEIGAYLPGLQVLLMFDNGFNGSLQGQIPGWIGNMSSLEFLDLSGNKLSGPLPPRIGASSKLSYLYLSRNKLQGPIPGWIGNMSSLEFLDLSGNLLSGPLPPRIGASSKLSYLYLSRNMLQGPIAIEFHNSSKILALDLSHNDLTGRIPEWIGRLSNLRYLLLSHNNLEGEIPIQLCRLDQLTLIDLSHNYLSGNILSCMISTHPIQYLDNYYYQPSLEFTMKNVSILYKGSILQYFSGVDFSCNNFTGKIPLEIGNLSKIKVLNLSHNSLIGSIPPTFSNLKEIESLDLSYNKLEGEIPPQLTKLHSLAIFSVAHNNLSGKTPAEIAQFGTFEESCYKDNPFLCGQPLPKACGPDMPPGTTYASYRREMKAKMAGLGVGVGFGALFLFIGLWWLYKVFKRKRGEKLKKKYFKRNGGLLLQEQLSSGEVNVEKIKMFPSKELDKATDHYNANRMLGQGGQGIVYKGMLADGKIVAIKKSKVIDEGNLRQFINEVVLLSQINHRNVVKLLGCCLETELPLLVYEFIPNGTLFQFLHDPNEEFPLTWEIRLRIAAEVAGALFYMHSAASIAIFHRDIKSTNILLDEKYRAKVADFGTSRSVSVDQTHVTTLVQGTFGYLDPEYFQSSQFTDKSDVYSFGVVLIELLTGQKPISFTRTEEQGRSLAMYFLMAMESNCLFDILDPQVVKQGKKEDVVMVASLARSCLRLNGKERPTMKEVTMVLERIQKSDNLIVQREIEYDIKEVMGAPWDATSPSTISSFGICASSSLDEKPLFHTY